MTINPKNIALAFLAAVLLSPTAMAADFTNSIGMKFKNIPAGSFYMGSCKLSSSQKEANKKRKFLGKSAQGAACPSGAAADNDAYDPETPQHRVRITKRFQIGMHEVTVGQFKRFLSSAGRDDLITDEFIKANSHSDQTAVSHVSWNDAQDFIRWLNKKEGGDRYRLPTEAEWEYAARAGTTTRYSWGNNAGAAGSYAWYEKNAYDRGQKYAHKVGQKKPNPWGLHDMHGNVREWVQDCLNDSYRGAPADGGAWKTGDCRIRVSRGGGWFHGARYLRSADRYGYSPDYRGAGQGFRLVRTP